MTTIAPQRRTWDLVLTVVLTVLLVPLAVVLAYAGAFLVMASDSCGSSTTCADDRLSAGVLVAMLAPAVAALVAIAVAVLRLVRGRVAFWVPLVGVVVMLGLAAAGAAIVFGAVGT